MDDLVLPYAVFDRPRRLRRHPRACGPASRALRSIDILAGMTAVGADATQPPGLDEREFAALTDEIRAYVADAGARWAERI